MHLYMQKLKNRKIPISFQFFCNIPNVICSHLPFVSIYYNVTLFIFEYVHKIIPDPPLVISPPLCIDIVRLGGSIRQQIGLVII